jgi:hypothetical protein
VAQSAEADVVPGRRFLAARLLFAAVWAVDAGLKWLPGFRQSILAMVTDAGAEQPSVLHPWFTFWTHAIGQAPTTFAVLIALSETAVFVSLAFGVLQRVGFVGGAILGLLIWGVGEGFGGPYGSGSTDIGCAVMYTVLFVSLIIAVPRAERAAAPAVDNWLVRRWPALAPLTFRR